MVVNVFLVVLFVFDFALIYMIYFYNPSGTINRFLSLLIIPIMLSNIEVLLLRTVESSLSLDIGLNMALLGGLTFFPIFYHFSYYYPRNVMTRRKKRQVVFIYFETIGLGVALFLSYLLKNETVTQADVFHVVRFFKINPVFFSIYIIMFGYAFTLLAVTILRFSKSYRLNLMKAEKRNIIMVLTGFIPTSLSMIFAYFIFLPLRSGINFYLVISSFFTVYFIILMLSFGYLDRKAAVRTLFSYPVTIIIIIILFEYGMNDLNAYVIQTLGLKLEILLVSEILLLMLFLQPIIRMFESRLYIGNAPATGDFHKLMKDNSANLVGIITLSELDGFLADVFLGELKLNEFHLMIKERGTGDFITINTDPEKEIRFPGYGELAGKLENYRRIMNIQQIALAWHEGEELENLYNRRIVLIAPLFERHELTGFCLFGEPGPARAWYPSEIEELEVFLSGVPVVIARCNTHEQAIALEKKQAAIEKMAVLSEISSGIAHEIRNPLSIISASAETMAVRSLSEEEVKRFASYIQDETTRMSHLLNRILSISVNSEVRHTPVNVGLVIQRALDLVSTKFRKKNLSTDFKRRSTSVIAVIDNEVLMQICLNLILNAIDAMSEGMRLLVSAEYTDDERVRIVFSNQGELIPEDVRGRIFDPFFTTKKTGTGLGLSITQRLLREASGEIKLLDSEKETVFEILLPAAAGSMR